MIKTAGKLKLFILFAGTISILAFAGCEQKTDKPGDTQEEITSDKPAFESIDTMQTGEDTMQTEAETVDLTGKWKGTFDKRSTTLNITEHNEDEFEGTISISYRDPLTKAVSGKFDIENNEFTMEDTQHSRYKGKYKGNLEDGKLSGTFTMALDGKSYSFNLTKQ